MSAQPDAPSQTSAESSSRSAAHNPFPKLYALCFVLLAGFALWTMQSVAAQDGEGDGEAGVAEELDCYEDADVRIRDIQGSSHTSPYDGKKVKKVPGVVTHVDKKIFYFQDEYPDDDNATSEGMAVYFYRDFKPLPKVGDRVLVSGEVTEYESRTAGGMTLTEIKVSTLTVEASKVDLPAPIHIGADGRALPTSIIDDDEMKEFDADEDGIDFWESLEGMRVEIKQAVVVGATKHGGFTVIGDGGKDCGPRSVRGGIVVEHDGEHTDYNPERVMVAADYVLKLPTVTVGDTMASVVGIVDYNYGSYQVYATEKPELDDRETPLEREVTELVGTEDQLTIASFNIENFSKADGDERADELAEMIVEHLKNPDIIGLQELQDNDGDGYNSPSGRTTIVDARASMAALVRAIRKADGPRYEYFDIPPTDDDEGGSPGGNIRVGYLYNPERVEFEARGDAGATTANEVQRSGGKAELKFNPGRVDPDNEAWERSRRPLAAEFSFQGEAVFVINCHLSSKRGDEGLFGPNQPPVLKSEEPRNAQAEVVNAFVKEILKKQSDAHVVVLGDMNEFDFAAPLQTMIGDEMRNLISSLPIEERYTYIYQGNSQPLDHIMVGGPLKDDEDATEIDVVHINAEYPEDNRSSDHDPVVARLKLAGSKAEDDEE